MIKISGITFVRHTVRFDYPVVESIKSILPIADDFIVNVGPDEDDTLGLIRLSFQEEGTTTWEKIGHNFILRRSGWRS